MAQERLAAHMIRDILRLYIGEGLPLRTAVRTCEVALSTAAGYCSRARARGLGWPLPAEMDEPALVRALAGEEKTGGPARVRIPVMSNSPRSERSDAGCRVT